MALAQSALGAITVHFVEEGSDVRVSFSGSIDLAGSPAQSNSARQLIDRRVGVVDSVAIFKGQYGYASRTVGQTYYPPLISDASVGDVDTGAFGFEFGNLFWDDRHVTAGATLTGVTELTADPLIDFFVLSGSSLASLNAEDGDYPEGATLWTSYGTSADTFVFSRIAPILVPEPYSLLLCGLGGLGLLRRRR